MLLIKKQLTYLDAIRHDMSHRQLLLMIMLPYITF